MENSSMIVLESKYYQLEQKHKELLDRSIGNLLKYKDSIEQSLCREELLLGKEIRRDLQYLVHLKESFQQTPSEILDESEVVSAIHRSLVNELQKTQSVSYKTIQPLISNSFSEVSGVIANLLQKQKQIRKQVSEKWKNVINSIEQKYDSLWKKQKQFSYSRDIETDDSAQNYFKLDSRTPKLNKKASRKNTVLIQSSIGLKLKERTRKSSISEMNDNISSLKSSFTGSSSIKKIKGLDKESFKSSGKATPSSIPDKRKIKHMKSEILGFCNPSIAKKKKLRKNSSNTAETITKGTKSASLFKSSKTISFRSKNSFSNILDLFDFYSSENCKLFERIASEIDNKENRIKQCLALIIRKGCLAEYQLYAKNADHQQNIDKINKLKQKDIENSKYIDRLKDKVSKLKAKNESVVTNSIKLCNDNNEIVKKMNEQTETIRKYKEEIDYLRNIQFELNLSLAKLNSEIDSCKEHSFKSSELELTQLKNTIHELKDTVHNKDLSIQKIKEESEISNKKHIDMIEEKEFYVEKLCKEIQYIKRELADKSSELSLAKEEITSLNDLIIEMNINHANEKNEMTEKLLDKNATSLIEIDSLRAELDEKMNSIASLNTKINSVNGKNQLLKDKFRSLLKIINTGLRLVKKSILKQTKIEIKTELENYVNLMTETWKSVLERQKEHTSSSEIKMNILQEELITLNTKLNEQFQKQRALTELEEVLTKMKKESGVSAHEHVLNHFEAKGHEKTLEISGDNIPSNNVSESISGISSVSLPSEIHQLQDEIQEEQRLVYQHEQQILALKLYIIDLESALKRASHGSNYDHFNEILIKFMLNLPKLNVQGEDMLRVILAMQGISNEEIRNLENTRAERNSTKTLGLFDLRNN